MKPTKIHNWGFLSQKRRRQKQVDKKRKSKIIISLWLACIMGVLLSCEPSVDEEPVDLGGSNIEGCQVVVPDTLFDLKVESFKILNRPEKVYVAFGVNFSVDFPGSVTEMAVKVPENGSYTVRIYNADELKNDILAETEITVNNKDWNSVSIAPLGLSPDEDYIACVYIPSKPEGQESLFYHVPNFPYPLEKGDLNIKAYAWRDVINEKLKPNVQSGFTIYNGLVDLCFEAD